MAQVKKLQDGGAFPSNTQTISIKRMYNGVELTDADLDKIVNDTAEFISKNSNYSEDIRGISELSNKVKEYFQLRLVVAVIDCAFFSTNLVYSIRSLDSSVILGKPFL